MRRLGRTLLLIVLLCVTAPMRAQQPLTTQLKPDLRVYPQFFALAQGLDGDLYVGGTDGVLRFDGGRWHWLALPRPGPVRALRVARDGRVWVGATNSFGYLERDPGGVDRFVDLAPRFAGNLAGRQFADVWRIAEGEGEIWFVALQDMFRVSSSGEPKGYWHHEGRFGGALVVAGQTWVQWRGEGLKRFDGSDFTPLPGGEGYAQTLVLNLFATAGGRVIVHTREGLSAWQDGRIIERTTPELAAQLALTQAGALLDDDHVALARSDGTLCIAAVDGAPCEPIRLGRDFIVDVMRGRDGALYALDDSGISRLDWPLRWRQWYGDSLSGIGALDEYDGALYLATRSGALRASWPRADAALAPAALDWTTNEAWAFHRHGGRFLFAESKRLFQITPQGKQPISADNLYPRAFLDDPLDPDLLWVGTEHGVALFAHGAEGYRLQQQDFRLGWLINNLVAHDGAIWAANEVDGVHRLRREAGVPAAIHFERVGAELGLPPAQVLPAQLSVLDGNLYASTSQGLFRYAQGRFTPDGAGGLADLLDERELVQFRAAPDGGTWAFSFHSIYRRDARGRWERSLLGGLRTGAIADLLPRAGGEVWVGCVAGLLQYVDGGASDLAASAPRPRVAAVQFVQRNGETSSLPLDRVPALHLNGGGLQFEFAYPRFDGAGGGEFQFTVDAEARNWSAWSNRASAAFFALPPGDYHLRLRARSRYGGAVEAEPFAFSIVPRWFERPWVWPLAAFIAASLLARGLIQRQRNKVRRLRTQNLELDRLVRARTRDLELANVQLRGLADSDGLTGLANRRSFDSVLGSAAAQARERGEALSLLMIDVDHFKRYNDDHGHQAGDDVLRALAAVMRECVRPDTLTARYGGEEFAVIAPHCDSDNAQEIAERIRQRLALRLPGVTISIGIATTQPCGTVTAGDLVAQADAALYRAKHDGRDRVEHARAAAPDHGRAGTMEPIPESASRP